MYAHVLVAAQCAARRSSESSAMGSEQSIQWMLSELRSAVSGMKSAGRTLPSAWLRGSEGCPPFLGAPSMWLAGMILYRSTLFNHVLLN